MVASIARLADAQRTSFRSFSRSDGLGNLGVNCLRQDQSGFVFACTEDGLYAFDGVRFSGLDGRQGLPPGGFVRDLVITAGGRTIIRYIDQVFVSDRAGAGASPLRLRFRAAVSEVGRIYDDRANAMTPWHEGAVFVDRGRLLFVDPDGPSGVPIIRRVNLPLAAGLDEAARFASVGRFGNELLMAVEDGRICMTDGFTLSCTGAAQGLPSVKWFAFLSDGSGHFLARSSTAMATLEPSTGTVRLDGLPAQMSDGSASYTAALGMIRSPSGAIVTQSTDGLIIGKGSHWRPFSEGNGLPDVPLPAMMFDSRKELWLGAFGRGVFESLGYADWKYWDRRDGLSSDLVWQIARSPDGPLVIGTNSGVDALYGTNRPAPLGRGYRSPAYVLSPGRFHDVWRSLPDHGLARIDTVTGTTEVFDVPEVTGFVPGEGDLLWFATHGGIYAVHDTSRPDPPRLMLPTKSSIVSMVPDHDGGLFFLTLGSLMHRDRNGRVVPIGGAWTEAVFDPQTLAIDASGDLWVGGSSGGVRRLTVVNDHVARMTRYGPKDTQSEIALAIMVDHRGWVWVGTDNGVSVFDGRRWVSADTEDGLVSNDIDQDALTEDTDGSIWIGTSKGLSHLLHPQVLFEQKAPQAVIVSASLGDRDYPDRSVPYTTEPVHITFGAPNARPGVRFRYLLDGVDHGWSETSLGGVRYSSIPPGSHRFSLVAVDPRTHLASAPVSIELSMDRPWWLWWPALLLYVISGFGLVYGVWRLRYGYLLRQRRLLHLEVERQTREIRLAQEALIKQASRDSLTGLLTRGEIQKRLLNALSLQASSNTMPPVAIGLLDIDHFKRINDHFGHLAGDDVLVELGARVRAAIEPGEEAGRYGGEEVLLIVSAEIEGGAPRIRELKQAICEDLFLVDDDLVRVTCSIGVAQATPQDSWKTLIGRADKALYQAKADGRDRVVVAQSTVFDARGPSVVSEPAADLRARRTRA